MSLLFDYDTEVLSIKTVKTTSSTFFYSAVENGKDGLHCIDGTTGEIVLSFDVEFYTNNNPVVADSLDNRLNMCVFLL